MADDIKETAGHGTGDTRDDIPEWHPPEEMASDAIDSSEKEPTVDIIDASDLEKGSDEKDIFGGVEPGDDYGEEDIDGVDTGDSTDKHTSTVLSGEVEIRTPVLIEIEKLHPNEWNPNEQSDPTFNQLVERIRTQGFKDPCTVTPHKEIEGHFRIIGGEHRYKAGKVLGMTKIPCYIEESWDEITEKLETVRDNILRGSLNSVKFTELVNSIKEKVDIDPEELANKFGFDDLKEFKKNYIEEREKRDKSFIDSLVDETKKEKVVTEGLTDILASIFDSGKATIDQNFMFFTYNGKLQTVVFCDTKTLTAVNKMGELLKRTGKTATEFMTIAIENEISNIEMEEGKTTVTEDGETSK